MSVLTNIKTYLANRANYGSARSTSNIKYIVIHYTSNDGDTDEGNVKYFRNNVVKASAHYFVDSDSITQSVPDNYIAYAVGGNKYSDCSKTGGGKYYGKCVNSNSISIELCDDVKNGVVYPSTKTVENALEMTEYLMNKYSIPKSNVIRHFDVTGKYCPRYWMDDNAWKTEFWNKLSSGGSASSNTPNSSNNSNNSNGSYLVKINTDVLNVRKGAGTSYPVVTTVKRNQVYTIVAEMNGWGMLKSGAGWIKLSYTQKI